MPRLNKLLAGLMLFSLLFLNGACGGSGNGGRSEMILEVDGTPVTISELSTGMDATGDTVIAASGSDWSIEIRFPGNSTGDFSSASSAGAEVTYTDSDGKVYVASDLIMESSYEITITSYDTKVVEGTFTFTVAGPDGGTLVITGSFKIYFPTINMANPYEGTYIGIFRVQGQTNEGTNPDPPYDIIWSSMKRSSFRVTAKLDHLATAAGSAVYYIVHANVTDPLFGCNVGGCTPTSPTSVATLPVPPGTPMPSGASQAGQGFLLQFPNGSTLGTVNDAAALYTSTDGRTTSNVLGLDQTWVSLDPNNDSYPQVKLGDIYTSLNPDTRSMTWALTKSAL